MIALLQRVSSAMVEVDHEIIGEIEQGLLVFLCAEPNDTDAIADKMLQKILRLRVFSDRQGRMNLSVQDINGGLLIVSQFTLAADTSSGTRPGFSAADKPESARAKYLSFVEKASKAHPIVASGSFGADMQVTLQNDGPVTIPLRVT